MKLFGIEHDRKRKYIIYHIFGFKISVPDELYKLEIENNYLRQVINQIGADKMPPATGDLRDWQMESFELLKEFDSICKENNVKYWLDFGTLLGAMRHKGFIPWDDDIDTSMLKEDIDKILPILRKHFKNSDYIIRMRAITMNNFQIRIRNRRYNAGIDIFQTYKYPEENYSENLRDKITEKIIKARNLFDKKYNKKRMEKEQVNQAIEDIAKMQNEYILPKGKVMPEHPVLFKGIDFPYEEGYYVMPYDEIFPLKEATFEGYTFPIPNKTEEYMSKLWGNWKEIPKKTVSMPIEFYEGYKNAKPYYKDYD